MHAIKRTIFVCLLLTPLTWSKPYEPCENISDTFCEFDCCYDYLTCRKNEDLVYLGADSITRIKLADGGFGINFAYRFYNLRIPIISQYWKPIGYNYTQWVSHKNSVMEFPHDEGTLECLMDDPRRGNLVASVLYHDDNLLVCRTKIIVFNVFTKYGRFHKFNRTILRDSSDCRRQYPLLCAVEKDQPELIDAFTLEEIVDGKIEEFMVAYYGESQIDHPSYYDREYSIARIVDGKPTVIDRVTGQLSAIDIYEIDHKKKVAKGLLALNDGRVCPFEHTIGDKNFDFERLGFIEDGCRAMQTYLACPQAWCVDAVVDSSFTVNQIQNKEEVYFILYNNMWVVESKPLPMDVPMHGRHKVWLHHYNKTTHSKTVQHVFKETSAAFTYIDGNGDEIVISSWRWNGKSYWKALSLKEHPDGKAYSISGLIGDIQNPDAAWFDKLSKKLYLFEGDKFYIFENEGNIYSATAWKEKGGGSTADLGLKDLEGNADDGIDAVVSMNGSNYFFNQRFRFYQIDNGQTQAKEPPKLVQKYFFRLLSQCYYNDFQAYREVLLRNKETEPEEQKFVNVQSEYTTASLQASKALLAPYIIGIIFFGGVFAIVGLILLFMHRKRKVVFQTTVVKRYEEMQPRSRSTSNRLRRKSTLKPLKSKSVSNSQKSKSILEPLKSKSVLKLLKSKDAVKSVTSNSPK